MATQAPRARPPARAAQPRPASAAAAQAPRTAAGVKRQAPDAGLVAAKEEAVADASVGTQAEADERVQRATDRVVIAEIEATQALESARAMLEGDVTEEHLQIVDELLQAQLASLVDANKALAADIIDARKTAPKALSALSKLTPRLRSVQAGVAQEIKSAKEQFEQKQVEAEEAVKRAAEEEKVRLAEQRDAKAFEEALPEAIEAVAQVEELLEVVVAAAGPLATEAVEDGAAAAPAPDSEAAEARAAAAAAAIRDTEAAVVRAQTGMKKARVHVNQKAAAAKQYAPEARKVALAEYAALQEKLNDVHKKLGPYLRIRKDHEEKLEANKLMVEISKHLEDMKKVKAEVEKAELMTTPLGDEQPSPDKLKEMGEAVKRAQGLLDVAAKSLEACRSRGSVGPKLAGLLEMAAEAQRKLDEMRQTMKEQRELAALYDTMGEVRLKIAAVEARFAATAQAEAPYLKGLENPPLAEATKAIADSEAAAAAVKQGLDEAQAFIKAQADEVRKLAHVAAKAGLEELDALSAKLQVSADRLAQFETDTRARKGALVQQQAAAKVDEAENLVKTAAQLSAEFGAREAAAAGDVPPEEAQDMCERFAEAERLAQAAIDGARETVVKRQREGRGQAKVQAAQDFSKLLGRLANAKSDLAKVKAEASEREQRLVGKMLMREATEAIRSLEGELEAASEVAAPLVTDGGKTFVTASMLRMVLEALRERAAAKGIGLSGVFAEIAPAAAADKQVPAAALAAFLARLPELCAREDLVFTDEQRQALLDLMLADAGPEKKLTLDQFVDLFRERYACLHPIAITDSFDIATSKALGKLEAGDLAETAGDPKVQESQGMIRVEVTAVKNNLTGWVTLMGNRGKKFLSPLSAYAAYVKNLDAVLGAARSSAAKAADHVGAKVRELARCERGPLAEAKADLAGLRPQVELLQSKLEQLQRRVEEGKKEHAKREEVERKILEANKERTAAALLQKATPPAPAAA